MNLFCAHEKDYIRGRKPREYDVSTLMSGAVKKVGDCRIFTKKVGDGHTEVAVKEQFTYKKYETANERRKTVNTLVRPMIQPTESSGGFRLVWA